MGDVSIAADPGIAVVAAVRPLSPEGGALQMDRFRLARMCVSVVALVGSAAMMAASASSAPAGAAAVSGPQCTFNGSALPIVTGASAGEKVKVSCTGLAPLHPYLTMETSLLLGIDPKAAPLLSGSITSVPGP
ncbi:MAG TPA: hypothetical protein VMQ59_05900, partial [Acidimicrobiales bacterium]|nr:hypothetical protein [Acidimicrobiales bacterium]